MLIDLLNSANYMMISRNAVKILGLECAAYCSELLYIYEKAYNKKKMTYEGFFKVDRSYIDDRTSIPAARQLELDQKLVELKIISIDQDNKDIIKIGIEQYASIIASQDVIKSKKSDSVNNKAKAMKQYITASDKKELKLLNDWLDTIFATKHALYKTQIEAFVNTLHEFTDDLEARYEIIKIATIQSYVDCKWAINSYTRSKNYSQSDVKSKPVVRTTLQRRATKLEGAEF